MSPRVLVLPHGMSMLAAGVVAVILAWRVIATGVDTLRESSGVANAAEQSAAATDPESVWRGRIARNPTDFAAMLALALDLERKGKVDAARSAAAEALRMAPTDKVVLAQVANFDLRSGDEAAGLATLRRYIELYANDAPGAFPVLGNALDSGRHDEFFTKAIQDKVTWWPRFFEYACTKATPAAIQRAFAMRLKSGVPTPDERRCAINRLQHEHQWANAYQLWLSSLPAEQRQKIGFVFNGEFESPISNLGFDWIVPNQDGVVVSAELTEGAGGRRALHVRFLNKRYSGSPVYEYLMLAPGRYRFDGRGRAEGLSSWLGVQWGLYCHEQGGGDGRQLAHSDAQAGSADWSYFEHDFNVSKDCPVQLLRLELANPQKDAKTGGSVAVRLRGGVWFDDLRVRSID